PDAMLPHLAERNQVYRIEPPRGARFVVLETAYRQGFVGTLTLFRMEEEPTLQNYLNFKDYGLFAVVGELMVFQRDRDARAYAYGRYLNFPAEGYVRPSHTVTGPSLTVAGWGAREENGHAHVTVRLLATV